MLGEVQKEIQEKDAEDSFWGFERAILYANWVGTK